MGQRPRPSPFYLFSGIVVWPILYGPYRYRARGFEHVTKQGGFVLAANHLSNFDPWALAGPFFPKRFLRFMTKSELFWWPMKVLLYAEGAFPVRRAGADVEAIQRAVELCREGNIVVMFPEGTRRRKGLHKKRTARARPGAAMIALRAGVPLVPAAILGTDGLARLRRIRVNFGAAIPLDDLEGKELREAAEVATERLMAEIQRLETTA